MGKWLPSNLHTCKCLNPQCGVKCINYSAGLSAVSSTTSMTPPPQARQPTSPSTVKIPRGMEKVAPVNPTMLGTTRRLSESSTSSLGSARVPQVMYVYVAVNLNIVVKVVV